MEAFKWDQRFETGLSFVDNQHRHLVELVNLAGDILLQGQTKEDELQALFSQLADYTNYHFKEEESLMDRSGMDLRHVAPHKTQHTEFLKQVTLIWNNRETSANSAAMFHDYLSSWLTVHILGQDQVMARILARMDSGMKAAEAYVAEKNQDDHRISPLLEALHRLYLLLSVQNHELANANLQLEAKVEERTRAFEEASRQVLESEKLASLGRMVAGFAHELNTPVGIAVSAISQSSETIQQLSTLLSQEEVSEDDFLHHLETLQHADQLALSNLQRASKLVQSFKRTSIDQASHSCRAFNIHELIRDVLLTLNNQFKHTAISIEIECPEQLVIQSTPGLIEQILTNLLLNSILHGYEKGTKAGKIKIQIALVGENRLRIIFTDDGVGMSNEAANQAFEPFFTTQRGHGGSGLGLYVCYDIVTNQLKGTIALETSVGKGVHFKIDFPCNHLGN